MSQENINNYYPYRISPQTMRHVNGGKRSYEAIDGTEFHDEQGDCFQTYHVKKTFLGITIDEYDYVGRCSHRNSNGTTNCEECCAECPLKSTQKPIE